MYIGSYEIGRQEISVAFMILFALAAMFFIGYYYAYTKAITYANEQMEIKMDEFRRENDIFYNPDIILGNIELPKIGGQNGE